MWKERKRRRHSQAGPQSIQVGFFFLLNEKSSLFVGADQQGCKMIRGLDDSMILRWLFMHLFALSPTRKQAIQEHLHFKKKLST